MPEFACNYAKIVASITQKLKANASFHTIATVSDF